MSGAAGLKPSPYTLRCEGWIQKEIAAGGEFPFSRGFVKRVVDSAGLKPSTYTHLEVSEKRRPSDTR